MAPLPKGGCQKSLIFDWGILHSVLYQDVYVFTYTSKVTDNFIVWYTNHNQIPLKQMFCPNRIISLALIFIVL